MKKIVILGSTGSIGTQGLDVIRNNKGRLEVFALIANTSYEMLIKQIEEFKPAYACINSDEGYEKISAVLDDISEKTVLLKGEEGIMKIVAMEEYDIILTATVGISGLLPTMEAIRHSKTIALANKETLVTAGGIVMREAEKYGSKIIPVDSEHCAIYQCLNGEDRKTLRKILLTASGGPFRGKKHSDLVDVTKNEALKHPNWSMGRKISIDSATLMNKGLEIIEAKWLFGVEVEDIEVVVHPQSIIHSMVEYDDSSVIAQLGTADMRTPIQYALLYPERIDMGIERLDITKIATLTFEKPDEEVFPCLSLAKEAIGHGMSMCTVLNAANEVLVEKYLNDEIKFYDIPKYIKIAMDSHKVVKDPEINDIIKIDKEVRQQVLELLAAE